MQIDGETVQTVSDFILGGSKITADGDCNHEIKRRLLLGRKVMTNQDSILKSRDIILPTKVHLVKAMVFPVVMYATPGSLYFSPSIAFLSEGVKQICEPKGNGIGVESWQRTADMP